MKKVAKAMYGKSMMKKGGKVTTKKMEMGGMSSGTMMKDSEMKMGGAKKLKMMKGGAKPKAMYGTSMKSGMMKMGGAKKMQDGGTLTSPQYIKDLNDYLQKGVLEDIRRAFLGPKKPVAKKPVAKKSSPKKS